MGILRADRITGLGGANAIKGSVFFNRSASSFLRTDIDDTNYVLGTDDFTLELWHNTPTLDTTNGLIMFGPGGYGYYNSLFHFSGADVQMYISSNGTSWDIASGTKIGERVVNTWHHYALTREGNTFRGFIDGVLGATFTSSGAIRQGSSEFNKNQIIIGHRITTTLGHISNFRYIKGRALYTAAFTPPVGELEVTSDTILLCCQSPSNILQEATGKTLIAEAGGSSNAVSAAENVGPPVASRFTPNSPVGFSTTTDAGSQYGSTFDGFGNFATSTYMVPPAGNTKERFPDFKAVPAASARGLFGGGAQPFDTKLNLIEFITISTTGNAQDFGDLTVARGAIFGCSSNVRGVFAGGASPSAGNTIDFVTISTTGDANDFGDLTTAARNGSGASNSTRGVFALGQAGGYSDSIDFITIFTGGNGLNFGDLTQSRDQLGSCASTTRGLFAGGLITPTPSVNLTNIIDFVTISTTAKATDFGDLLQGGSNGVRRLGGLSNAIRGLFAGGESTGAQSNIISFITMATTGDAQDFGDLSAAVTQADNGASSSVRGVFHLTSPANTTLHYVTINTAGNSTDFGDMTSASTVAGMSNGHGGLG